MLRVPPLRTTVLSTSTSMSRGQIRRLSKDACTWEFGLELVGLSPLLGQLVLQVVLSLGQTSDGLLLARNLGMEVLDLLFLTQNLGRLQRPSWRLRFLHLGVGVDQGRVNSLYLVLVLLGFALNQELTTSICYFNVRFYNLSASRL